MIAVCLWRMASHECATSGVAGLALFENALGLFTAGLAIGYVLYERQKPVGTKDVAEEVAEARKTPLDGIENPDRPRLRKPADKPFKRY